MKITKTINNKLFGKIFSCISAADWVVADNSVLADCCVVAGSCSRSKIDVLLASCRVAHGGVFSGGDVANCCSYQFYKNTTVLFLRWDFL